MRKLPLHTAAIAFTLATNVALADEPSAPRNSPGPTPVAATRPASAPAGFTIPSPSGKPLAASPDKRVFRVPLGFARVERFYRDLLGATPEITITVERAPEGKTLVITSRRAGDSWARAVAREGTVDTTIEVTPVVRSGPLLIETRAPQPQVHFVMPPSAEVARQAASIDHFDPPKR